MSELSAYSSRSRFDQAKLQAARTKPDWCSSIRWKIELGRRASGRDRGMRNDLNGFGNKPTKGNKTR